MTGASKDLAQGIHGLVIGWAGQSGVLAPWDVTAVAAPRLCRHLPATRDLDIKNIENFSIECRKYDRQLLSGFEIKKVTEMIERFWFWFNYSLRLAE